LRLWHYFRKKNRILAISTTWSNHAMLLESHNRTKMWCNG
jgi:hypothetical protein